MIDFKNLNSKISVVVSQNDRDLSKIERGLDKWFYNEKLLIFTLRKLTNLQVIQSILRHLLNIFIFLIKYKRIISKELKHKTEFMIAFTNIKI